MAKQLKSDTLDMHLMIDMIKAWFVSADDWMKTEGAQWYPDTLAFARQLSAETGYTIVQTVAVIAAYSPQTRWLENKVDAANLLHGRAKRVGVMGSNHERAQRVLRADDPIDELTRGSKSGKQGGPKMHAFALNILGNQTVVTIDTWAIRAALGLSQRNEDDTDVAGRIIKWVGAYERISEAYHSAAFELDLPVTVVQATVWIAVRGKAD